MKKLKVDFEKEKDLNELILDIKEGESLDNVIKYHLENKWNHFKSLNNLTISELCRALFIGYELEKNPEEEILETYNIKIESEYDKGFNEGIEFTLDKLNVFIKGINA